MKASEYPDKSFLLHIYTAKATKRQFPYDFMFFLLAVVTEKLYLCNIKDFK